MDQHYLRQFEQLCTQESPPACQTTCPIHVEARTFLDFMRAGKVRDARKCLERTMPLASLVGLLCEGHCHAQCARARVDATVNIALVERACVLATSPSKPFPLPASGKSIAVVGGTLSGLTVAFELAKKGHSVTVFYAASLVARAAEPVGEPVGEPVSEAGDEAVGKPLVEEFSKGFSGDFSKDPSKQAPHSALEKIVVEKAVAEALDQLKALNVVFSATQEQGTAFLEGLGQDFGAVYIALDAEHLVFSPLQDLQGFAPIDDFTLQSAKSRYFIGVHRSFFKQGADSASFSGEAQSSGEALFLHGFSVLPPGVTCESGGSTDTCGTHKGGKGARDTRLSPIERVAMGKRAAGSIDRFLQGVDAATAREVEFVHPTDLYTNTEGVEKVAPILAVDEKKPTLDEGQAEAARCISCSCLECVKHCAFLTAFETYPKKLARAIFNGFGIVKGFRQTNKATNSCAECGLCAAVCPNNADMGVFCAMARKTMVRDKHMPPSAHEFALLDMEQSNECEVAFFRHQPGFSASSHIFFPGCQLPATLPKETSWAYEHLCHTLEGGVGLYFHCCGAPARWSGREKLTKTTADMIQGQWEASGKPEVIVACASCLEFFKAELPHIPCRSLWDVFDASVLPEPQSPVLSGINEEMGQGNLGGQINQPDQKNQSDLKDQKTLTFTLHDPCAARGEASTQLAVRHLLAKQSVDFEEMPMQGALTRCCGYGGLASSANPSLGTEFAKLRAGDSPFPMVAYCAVCRERLAAEGKETIHLLELLYGVDDMEQSLRRKPLGISERQYARQAFREAILNDIWNEEVAKQEKLPFTLTYGEGVRELMEQRRIREDDVVMVLEHAIKNGPLFKDLKKQWNLASLRPKQVTFWVRYEEVAPDEYCIYDAYCHRMLVPGVPGEGKDSPSTLEGFCAKAVC